MARSSCEKPWRSFFIVALCKQSECTWKVLHDTRTKTHSGEHYFLLQLNPRSNYFTFRALSGLLESKSNWGRLGQSLSQFVSDLSHPSGKSKERRKKEVNSDKARGDSCLIYLVREGSGYGEERGIKWRTHCTSTQALGCNISYFNWVNLSGSVYFVCTFDYYDMRSSIIILATKCAVEHEIWEFGRTGSKPEPIRVWFISSEPEVDGEKKEGIE